MHICVEKLVRFLCDHCVLEITKHLIIIRVAEQKLGVLLAAGLIDELREHFDQTLPRRF